MREPDAATILENQGGLRCGVLANMISLVYCVIMALFYSLPHEGHAQSHHSSEVCLCLYCQCQVRIRLLLVALYKTRFYIYVHL